jgi:hypothetical protein
MRVVPVIATLALLVVFMSGASNPLVAAESDCVTIEDFAKAKVGEFPPDWKVRKDAGKTVYSVHEEGGKRFLHGAAKDVGIQAAKQFDTWNLEQYPVLAWSWRPGEFPAGSDERVKKKNDSALAVYAVFPHSPVSVKSLKYVWSAVVPVGTHLTDSKGLTQVRIIQTGTGRRGQWIEERVNVRDDYKKLFGDGEVPKPAGIAVLTDADDTGGSSQGDYANFRACRAKS